MNSASSIHPLKKPIVLLGTSRKDSNTQIAVSKALEPIDYDLINLRERNINHYEYEATDLEDDFIPIAEKILNYPILIFSTPIYWYSMSAVLKVFIDRFSNLTTTHKHIGRALKGKKSFVITSYAGIKPAYFESPFQDVSQYFKMEYQSCLYYYTGNNSQLLKENDPAIKTFSKKVQDCLVSHI